MLPLNKKIKKEILLWILILSASFIALSIFIYFLSDIIYKADINQIHNKYLWAILFGTSFWVTLFFTFALMRIRYLNTKKYVALIRINEENHRILLDNIQMQIWYLTDDHTYGAVNKAHASFHGIRVNKIAFRDIYDIFPKEIANRYQQENKEVFTTGRTIKTESQITNAFGKQCLISTIKSPISDNNGSIQYVVCSAEDITERKQVQKTLKEKEKFTEKLLNDMITFVGVLEPNGNIIFINNRPLKISGIKLENITGEKLYNTSLWAYSDKVQKKIKNDIKKCASGKPVVHDIQMQTADKSLIWIEFSMHPIYNECGVVEFLIPEGRDITQRKQIEEALKKSETKFRGLIEASCDWIWELNSEGAYTYTSPQVENILGYTPDEIIGKTLFDLMPPEEAARVSKIVDNLKKTDSPIIALQNINLHKDGSHVVLESSAVPIFDKTGILTGYHGIDRDISIRIQHEKEKLDLERQLLHTQKLESLGVLAGGIAHDFNNLLMVILGNADLALDKLAPASPAINNIHEIEKTSKRAAELAKQMLAYSGKGKFVIKSINLNQFINEMGHLLEVSISKNAVIKYTLADNLPAFDGDATQIRQIIMNLITNASEAIGNTSGTISLSTGIINCDRIYLDKINETLWAGLEEPLKEGIYIYLEVADTGCGMKLKTIEKIFDPFFTTKFIGRGLGLSAVLGIIRGHKGGLKIYSEINKGTTFKIIFPSNKIFDNSITVQKKNTTEEKIYHKTGTILLVDDEENICSVGRDMLEHLGFDVLTAPDGRKAIEIFRTHADKIICVLLDLTMPHMNGEETFRKMRDIRPDVKVILSSGYNEQDATQTFTGKGLAGFIQKPYPMATLKEKLKNVLKVEK